MIAKYYQYCQNYWMVISNSTHFRICLITFSRFLSMKILSFFFISTMLHYAFEPIFQIRHAFLFIII